MKNLKMKIMVVITVMSLLLSTVVIFAASNNWADQVFIKANEQIGKAGFNKKQQLISNMDSRIADHVASKTDGEIENKKGEVEEALEDYFVEKLDELTDTPEFVALDGQMEVLRDDIVNRYKTEIDTAFGF